MSSTTVEPRDLSHHLALTPLLLGLLVGCQTPAIDPVEWELSVVEAQRAILRAAESELVLRQLADAQAGGDAATLIQVTAVAAELGLTDPIEASAGPRALDGREAGVTQAHGAAVLAGVRRGYRIPVDEAAWSSAAGRALSVSGGERPEAVIQLAVDGGMPVEQAVVWGTEAALASLDTHTAPVWPSQIAQWRAHHAGVTVGVGLTLDEPTPGFVRVVTPWPGGPAYDAGLHQGNVIVAVDGAPVASLAACEQALQGEEAASVELTTRRDDEVRSITAIRRGVPQETVRGWRRLPDHGFDPWLGEGIAYVRITGFRPDTDERFLELLGDDAPRGIVLDLRGNPGGDVQAAVNVVDAWVDTGVMATMKGRGAPVVAPEEGVLDWNDAVPGGPLVGVPTVVLVDGDSASAAEIVAGSLQQLASAHVLGATTYGKGSSQALQGDDKAGVAWQVTNMAWALPDGHELLPGKGVVPDEVHVATPAERWQSLRLARVREHPVMHADGSPMRWVGPQVREELPVLLGDAMVLKARRYLQSESAE